MQERSLFISHTQEIPDIRMPVGATCINVIQPQLLRKDEKLGVVGILTQAQLRAAMLDSESSWTLGTLIRGLLTNRREEDTLKEIEKIVVPAWAVGLLAALDIPTIYGKPIVGRIDELDIWELHWVSEKTS